MVKNLPDNVGDVRNVGSIPGLGRSPGEGNGNPLQYSCLENSMDRGVWWAAVHGVTKSWIWLKRLRRQHALFGPPYSSDGKESACNAGDKELDTAKWLTHTHTVSLKHNFDNLISVLPHVLVSVFLDVISFSDISGWEDPLEKEMATHSNIFAWKIPWTEESGGLQSKGSQRMRHDWMTKHAQIS